MIHLDFSDFLVEEHPNGLCSWDSVEIWDFVTRNAGENENTVPAAGGNTLTETEYSVEDSQNPQGTVCSFSLKIYYSGGSIISRGGGCALTLEVRQPIILQNIC